MGKIICQTNSLDEACRCITQLQNAAVSSEFAIINKARTAEFIDNKQLSSFAIGAFSLGKHLFSGNQITSYQISLASHPTSGRASIQYSVNYMAEAKAINDLRCTCAVISRDIQSNLGPFPSFSDKIRAVQKFFISHFKYRDSKGSNAHSAVDLLRSGEGVCQAIASAACLILPWIGIDCLFVSGEGFDGDKWGPHGWNAVKTPEGNWVFVDFTFGLNTFVFPPSTINKIAEKRFAMNHRWDAEQHSEKAFEATLSWIAKSNATVFTVFPDKTEFFMDGISVSSGFSVLQSTNKRYSINLTFLFRLLGGGVEYIQSSNRLHFVLYNREMYIENAETYICPGGFDVRSLNVLPISYSIVGQGLEIQLGAYHE